MGFAKNGLSRSTADLGPIVYTEDLLVNSWIGALQSDGSSWFLWEMAGRALGLPVAIRPVFSGADSGDGY